MSLFVKDGGVWKESGAGGLSVKDANAWKPVDSGFVKDAGVWKQFYQNAVYLAHQATPANGNFGSAFQGRPGIDASGNIYYPWLIDSTKITVQKLDSNGALQWSKSIPTTGSFSSFSSFLVDSSGNSYFTFESTNDTHLVKLNSSGVVQYSKNYGGSSFIIQGASLDASGNLFLCGRDFTNTSRNLTLRVNSSTGAVITGLVSTTGGDSYDATSDSSGNIYIATRDANYPIVAKLNSSFGLIWGRRIFSSTIDELRDIKVDGSGNVYASGKFTVGNFSYPCVYKFNSSGTVQWIRTMDVLGGAARAEDLALDPSGNVYVLLNIGSQGYVVKFDPSANVLWQRSFDVVGFNTNTYGLFVEGSTSVSVLGQWINSVSPFDRDARLLKVPQDGSKTGSYGSVRPITWAASNIAVTARSTTINSYSFSFSTITPSVTEKNKVATDIAGTFNTTIIP